MNTLAGLKLKIRKAAKPPASAEANTTTGVLLEMTPITIKYTATGSVTPAARPSRPSVRLTALLQPTMINAAMTIYTSHGMFSETPANGMYRLGSK